MRRILIGLIKLYRAAISPFIVSSCRYSPTCSEYAIEAVAQHGIFHGCWLALRRVGRCHPLGGDGFDPVPERHCNHHKQ